MSTAEHIVLALIENDLSPEEFMKSFGARRLMGFYYVPARQRIGRYQNEFGAELVYVNSADGTREFIGVINRYLQTGQWYPIAMAKPTKGESTGYMVLRNEPKHDTRGDAALALFDYYDFHKRMQQESDESELTPEQLVRDTPELLVRYEFTHTLSKALDVKRWEGGGYYYLGSVIELGDGSWAPYALAPVGKSHHTWVLSVHEEDKCSTREEATKKLWGIYKAEMDSAKRR